MIRLILLTIIATKTWTSDIPWQCVQVDHCSNTICPGRTVRGVGCEENPFYSLTNFITNESAAYTAHAELYTGNSSGTPPGLPSGYYNLAEILQLDTSAATLSNFADYSSHASQPTQE